jgi:uncharacterized protein YjdB
MKMRNWAFAAIAAIIALSFAFTGCGDDSGGTSTVVWVPDVVVTGVTLDKATMGLFIEDETGIALSATVAPANATNKNVVWSISPAGVISFDGSVVTPKALGTATITVKTDDGGHKATCVVTVGRIPAETIELDKSTLLISPGDFDVLSATVGPDTAADLSVRWETSDITKAIVTPDGTVWGISIGTVTITARTHNNLFKECVVTVSNINVESVTIDPEELELELLTSDRLSFTLDPPNATIKKVTWESSDPDTVSVDDTGFITALQLGDPVTITVKTVDGEHTADCVVTVWSTPVESVSLNVSTANLMMTKTLRLTPTVLPADASDKRVTWTSGDTTKVTVLDGRLTSVALGGPTTITVTTVDGSKTASCAVTVIPFDVVVPEVWIPSGTFTRGAVDTETGFWDIVEGPQHSVTITKGFYMSVDGVSQEVYRDVMKVNPSHFNVEDSFYDDYKDCWPVDMVNWFTAVEFCNKLSEVKGYDNVYTITNRVPAATAANPYPITSATVVADWSKDGYRLPTDAEWEYACRAGTTKAFNFAETGWEDMGFAYDYWGYITSNHYWAPTTLTGNWGSDYIVLDFANFDGESVYNGRACDMYGEWWGQSVPWRLYTTEGEAFGNDGLDHANKWGLYNMHGNLTEWVWDWLVAYTATAVTDPHADTQGPLGNYKSIRGGAWEDPAGSIRSGSRNGGPPNATYFSSGGYASYIIGFRIVRNGVAPVSPKALIEQTRRSPKMMQDIKLLQQQRTRNIVKDYSYTPVKIETLRMKLLGK